jgi:hypothetical protein
MGWNRQSPFMPRSAAARYNRGMKKFLTLFRCLAPGLLAAMLALPAHAGLILASAPAVPTYVVPVAADCNAIGQSVAARSGGTLLRAVSKQRGGQEVCVITYTVPGKGGQPPRRVETVVNAN